ncbi:MAG: hypothetical protein ACK40Z_05250 [Dietzia sp.]
MTSSGTGGRQWLSRPARPTAVVLFAAAALLAVLTAIALIDLFTGPLPPVRYGPLSGPHALTTAVVLLALLVGLGIRAARGLSPKALILTLLSLIAAWPIGWGLALLDSLGPDVINSAGSASAFVELLLLVVAPMVTIVGVVATLAEIVRRAVDAPRVEARAAPSATSSS